MIQILEMTLNAEGAVTSRGALPMSFDTVGGAVNFITRYLDLTYPEGKRGYQDEDGYWWAYDEAPHKALHCYTIETDVAPPRPA